jgi:glycosyltransferase involved in cell wall biosynthesis
MKISFVTSGHDPFDDRIFYHMARSLSDHNENIEIISSKYDLNEDSEGIKLNCFAGDNLTKKNKIKSFAERLSAFKPDLIVCAEPLPILAAKYYSKKQNRKIRIIYDVTEWYPSKKNLATCVWPLNWIIFLKLLLFNLLVTRYVDSFIFGEWYKSRPYRFLYPWKSFIFTPYFPDLKYISYCSPGLVPQKLRLSYNGKISLEKGYGNFAKVVRKVAEINKGLKIELTIIGWYECAKDKEECESLLSSDDQDISVRIFEKQDYRSFTELINKTDIFLDLRSNDTENQHCLPIKLFYYTALGRPVIISDLKAIRKEVEIDKFGFLVRPENSELIAQRITNYLNDKNLYYLHCKNARTLAVQVYNWQNAESQFIKFITDAPAD